MFVAIATFTLEVTLSFIINHFSFDLVKFSTLVILLLFIVLIWVNLVLYNIVLSSFVYSFLLNKVFGWTLTLELRENSGVTDNDHLADYLLYHWKYRCRSWVSFDDDFDISSWYYNIWLHNNKSHIEITPIRFQKCWQCTIITC